MKVLICRTLFALTLAVGGSVSVASAQTPPRLARPNASAMTSDGKLSAPAEATIGNLVVDLFDSSGKAAAVELTTEFERKAAAAVMEITACQGVTSTIANGFVSNALKTISPEGRAKLKAHDPESLTGLSISVLAALDGVSAEAIRADEAIGPGAYHDAILGLNASLVACRFFGLEGSL